MKSLNNNHLFRLIFVVLGAAFSLGILPFSARAQTYNLADLIDNNRTIEVGSLTFYDFGFISFGSSPETPIADPAGILLKAVGIDTPQPGLKIVANNQLMAVTGPDEATAVQISHLFYRVAIDTSIPIQASSFLLVPSSVASGTSSKVDILNFIGSDEPTIEVSTFHRVSPAGVDQHLLAEADFSSSPKTQLNIFTEIHIEANRNGPDELGQAALCAIEQTFKLADTRADAGPDQVVQDTAILDGSGSEGNGLTYEWRLIPRDPSALEITPEPVMNPRFEVEGLAKGFYDVTLTVTDENGLVDTDTMLLAAAGACEDQDGSLPPAKELHLWRFKIKKYKYCNWAFARVYGTVDASDLPLDSINDEDGLKARVILQVVDNDGNALGEWSAETAAEIKDRKYKYVIRNKW